MRHSHLDFLLLSEGRLETIDALFEMDQLSRASMARWENESPAKDKCVGGGAFTSLFNVIKRCLNLGIPRTGNQRGNDGNTKTSEGLGT